MSEMFRGLEGVGCRGFRVWGVWGVRFRVEGLRCRVFRV